MADPLLFTPIQLRDVTLKNRVVIAPMHQYSAVKGYATDWHLMNAGRFAAGGAGLVIMESTKVERRGCGTIGDLGIWKDEFIPGLKRCVEFIRSHGAVPGIQLGHSGRKARRFRPWEGGAPLTPSAEVDDWEAWEIVAPSALASPATDPTPRALSRDEIPKVVEAWGQAARRAHEAGFEVLDVHGAHGYLIHEFLSPSANRRNDEYGGTELNRMRFCIEVIEAVRAGKFHIYAISTVDEGIELLTGVTAGQPDKNGRYLEGTINARVLRTLHVYSERVRNWFGPGGRR
jgi:2,4-dienoyl-CoA reductase-like NADH-dependent reductase (Old Yellow Enzyme family)